MRATHRGSSAAPSRSQTRSTSDAAASAPTGCRGARACASSRVSRMTSSSPALSSRCEISGGTATSTACGARDFGALNPNAANVACRRLGTESVQPSSAAIATSCSGRLRRRVRRRRRPRLSAARDRSTRPAPPPRRARRPAPDRAAALRAARGAGARRRRSPASRDRESRVRPQHRQQRPRRRSAARADPDVPATARIARFT